MIRRTFLSIIPGFAFLPFASRAASHLPPTNIEIKGFAYDPAEVEITAGHDVIWTNMDGARHTVTFDNGRFDSGRLRRGESTRLKFTGKGEYTYFCALHPNMKGKIIVV